VQERQTKHWHQEEGQGVVSQGLEDVAIQQGVGRPGGATPRTVEPRESMKLATWVKRGIGWRDDGQDEDSTGDTRHCEKRQGPTHDPSESGLALRMQG